MDAHKNVWVRQQESRTRCVVTGHENDVCQTPYREKGTRLDDNGYETGVERCMKFSHSFLNSGPHPEQPESDCNGCKEVERYT